MARITAAQRLTEKIAAFEIEAPEIASIAEAGQIVLLRLGHLNRSVPKEIAHVDRIRGTLTILSRGPANSPLSPACARPAHEGERKAQERGGAPETTRAHTAHDSPDIEITGPLGRKKSNEKWSKVLFVAEATGIGAIIPRLGDLRGRGCYAMVIAGYPSKTELFWTDRLNESSDELYVVTEDGSYGIKGPIRQTLKAVCEQVSDIDHVYAAGSLRLLKTTADVARNFHIATTASFAAALEEAEESAPQISTEQPAAQAPQSPDMPETPEAFQTPSATLSAASARENFDWNQAVDVDVSEMDFDALAKKLGIPITR